MGKAINIESEIFTNVKHEKFALDTNVLYWMFYDKCSYSNEKRQKKYQNVVTKLKLHNTICVSSLCLYELFVVIEKNEYKLYCDRYGYDKDEFKLKDYRNIDSERRSVREILGITYKNIRQFTDILPQTLDKNAVENITLTFHTHQLDVFDKALADFCIHNKISNIITDDRDYTTALEALNIYTANNKYFG